MKIYLNGNPVELITTHDYWGAVQELLTIFTREMSVPDARPLVFFLTGTNDEKVTEAWMMRKFPDLHRLWKNEAYLLLQDFERWRREVRGNEPIFINDETTESWL